MKESTSVSNGTPPGSEADDIDEPAAHTVEPLELPRLRITHFMALTAAVAIALVPFSIIVGVSEANDNAGEGFQASLLTSMWTLQGVASGIYLFLVSAVAYWRWIGWRAPLQPGHWLAVHGFVGGMFEVLFWSLFLQFGPGLEVASLAQALVSLVMLVLFLWLAIRSKDSATWRSTYAAIGLSPVIVWLGTVLVAFRFGPADNWGFYIPHIMTSAVVSLLIMTAMWGDARRRQGRHWSHSVGAATSLAVYTLMTAWYVGLLYLE